jgi:hypothetical protein
MTFVPELGAMEGALPAAPLADEYTLLLSHNVGSDTTGGRGDPARGG